MSLFDFFFKKKKPKPSLDFIRGADINKLKEYIEIPDAIQEKLTSIDDITVSSQDVAAKVDALYDMYSSLTDEQKQGREGRYFIIRIGEVCYAEKMIDDALDNFNFAMKFSDTLGNPYLHMRLGQLQYCLGNQERQIDELSRALIMGGEAVFNNESPLFLQMVKAELVEPDGTSWQDYEGQDWASTK